MVSIAFGTALLLGVCAAPARAEPAPEVLYAAPAECPDASWLETALAARSTVAHRTRVVTEGRASSLEVRVVRVSAQHVYVYRGLLGVTVEGTRSERTFEGERCEDVTLALAIALALHLDAREEPVREPASLDAGVQARPIAVTAPSAEQRLLLGAGARSGIGPDLAPSVAVGYGLSLPRPSGFLLRASLDFAWTDTSRLAFRAVTSATEVCPVKLGAAEDRVWIAPCGLLEVGRVWGEDRGSGSAVWLAPGVSARASVALLGPVAVEIEGAVIAPLVRPRFFAASTFDRTQVHEVPPVTFSTRIFAALSFR